MKTGSGKTREPSMPFSNSTEGYGWMANWCDRCIHDKARATEPLRGPFDRRAVVAHATPSPTSTTGPPPRTEPLPTPPGQGELIPMDPYVGTRMFSDVVAEVTPSEVSS